MEDIERIKRQLTNIQSVEPIITSVRTIAAGSWRLALSRLQACDRYLEHLKEVIGALLPPGSVLPHRRDVSRAPVSPRRPLMLVIASERGLCGAFNETVLSGARAIIELQELRSDRVLVAALGRKAETHLSQAHDLFRSYPLPVTQIASLAMVRDMGRDLAAAFYAGEVDAVYVVYSPHRAGETLAPISHLWLPIDTLSLGDKSLVWPEPIVATDSRVLLDEVIEEWISAQLFHSVVESAASEQGARFRAMDAASTNLNELVEELSLRFHSARQHMITMEMLDLVAAAGMLSGRTASKRG